MAIDLDAILAKSEAPAEPVVEPTTPTEPVVEPAETPEVETPTEPVEEPTIKSLDEPVEPTEPNAEPEAPVSPASMDELDLDEYEVEVDGQSRSVSELLNERNELAARVAAVEKDEFLMRFLDHYQKTGDATSFLKSQTVNWDTTNDLEVLRQKFDKENSDLDKESRDILFSEELQNKYKIDPYTAEEDVDKDSASYKLGKVLQKRDADKARTEFKEEQKKFAVPAKQAEKAPVDVEKQIQEYKASIVANKDIAKFLGNKLLKINSGSEDGKAFGFEVDKPEGIIEMMTNDVAFWKTLQDPITGSPDRIKQAKVYAYAQNPDAFESQLVEFGKTQAREEILKEKRNTDDMNGKGSKGITGTGDDFATGFLKAMRQQKKS